MRPVYVAIIESLAPHEDGFNAQITAMFNSLYQAELRG